MRRHSIRRPQAALRAATPRFEALEGRQLLSSDLLPAAALPIALSPAQVATAVPTAIGRAVAPSSVGAIGPMAMGPATPGPFTPAQIRHAYGVDQLTGEDGTGQTIAIVDAYDDTTVAADLAHFDSQFGLPAAKFVKATPQGVPAVDSGWDLEISLDVEWAHAIAPNATILLVEAASSSDTNLLGAVDYAVAQGASQVSMSWGGDEYAGESSLDTHFNKPGVTFLASSGDSAGQLDFPAISPYVTSVGGTTVSLDAAGDKLAESAWSSGGGGLSTQVARPAFQAGFNPAAQRGTPDVSYDADPNSGVYVYDGGQWYGVGGTSAGAPQWAGLIALANQGLASAGKSSLGTGQAYGTNSVLYQLAGGTSYTNPNGDFLDITSGSNSHDATTGYDLATGLGSPVANRLVPDLIAPVAPPTLPTASDPGFEQVAVGAGNYAYDPSGSPWTFASSSGITGNNSGFTSGNPAAPQGSQVAFLQVTGSFSQSIANWSAGNYTIAFQAAQRGNLLASEDFAVTVDGKVVGTFKPNGASYQQFTTAAFAVAAGAHTVAFVGLDTAGGDNTAFIDAVTVAVAVAAPTAPTAGDSGFEQVAVGAGNYAYDPSGSPWTFASSSGITGNNSGFTSGNPAAPQGSQVAFLQVTGSISQSIANWAAGSYTIAFQAAQRGNIQSSSEDFAVTVDGKVVGTFKPYGSSYQAYTTSAFTVTAGAHIVAFVGLDTAGGDNTALIDAVTVAVAVAGPTTPTASDPGFEQIPVGPYGYVYDPTNSPWSFASSAGVTGNNSGFTSGNPAAPQGSQVAFLQVTGSVSQSIANWAAGSYTIAFQAAQRGNIQSSSEDFAVTVDGKVVGTFKPAGAPYQAFTTAAFAVTAGAHTVAFVGLDTSGGDNTALIDAVTVASA